jgi:SSS family solute:Na+ symporter
MGEWPLVAAFLILAAYTYTSGLRAPAAIAIVKDVMLYIMVVAAVIFIPTKLGRLRAHLQQPPGRR